MTGTTGTPGRPDPEGTSHLTWRPWFSPWPLRVAVILFVVGVAGVTVDRLVTATFPGDDLIGRLLDLDSELSIGTWYSVVQFVAAATLSMVALRAHSGTSLGRGWATFAVLMIAASIDEISKLHEHLAGLMSETLGISAWFWVVPGALVAALVVLALGSFLRAVDTATARRLLVGLGLFAAGALVLEGASGIAFETAGRQSLVYGYVANLEELFEMTGIALVLRAIVLHLEARGVELRLRTGTPT